MLMSINTRRLASLILTYLLLGTTLLNAMPINEALVLLELTNPKPTKEEVNKAYRKKALELHPDKTSNLPEQERSEKEALFKKVNNAKECIDQWIAKNYPANFDNEKNNSSNHFHEGKQDFTAPQFKFSPADVALLEVCIRLIVRALPKLGQGLYNLVKNTASGLRLPFYIKSYLKSREFVLETTVLLLQNQQNLNPTTLTAFSVANTVLKSPEHPAFKTLCQIYNDNWDNLIKRLATNTTYKNTRPDHTLAAGNHFNHAVNEVAFFKEIKTDFYWFCLPIFGICSVIYGCKKADEHWNTLPEPVKKYPPVKWIRPTADSCRWVKGLWRDLRPH